MVTSRQILVLVAASWSIGPVPAARAPRVPIRTVSAPGAPAASTSPGAGPSSGANLILNGDFENYSGGTCDSDLTNAAFTAMMANATGFGAADEIDVYSDPTCPGFSAPSGARSVAVRRQADGDADAFSLALGTPTVAGETYTLKFLAAADVSLPLGSLQIGLSDSATTLGVPVYACDVPDHGWILITTTFVAPIDADYLTVTETRVDAWTQLDAFELWVPSLGWKYCMSRRSTTQPPADIAALGSASSSAGDLTLTAAPVHNQPGIFFHGGVQAQIPFQVSFLCTVGTIVRGARIVGSFNMASYTYDNSDAQHSLAMFVGATRHFQYWFRDPDHIPYWSNTSTAIAITILP